MINGEAENRPLVGRFAPSPTGSLHLGTLIAAAGSYLAVKSQGGAWRVRIEDLDLPRVVPGAADSMLRILEQLGFEWDGDVVYQSRRKHRYAEIIAQLFAQQQLFRCSCSRREIMASAPHPGEEGPVYPGFCRQGPLKPERQTSIRLRVPDREMVFDDLVFGQQRQNLEKEVGDFVLYRADGQYAYQLAVVVDDMDAGVTQVVRGADLLMSTPRQIYLLECLGGQVPHYCHLPLALGRDGEKLSKRHGNGVVVDPANAVAMLWYALDFLGQQPPAEMLTGSGRDMLAWGVEHFSYTRIPGNNYFFAAVCAC